MATAKNPNQPQSTREKIRAQHESQQRAQKRNSLLLRLGVIALVLAVIAIVAIIIVGNSSRSIPEAGPAPAGASQAGGITFVSATETAQKAVEEVSIEGMEEPSEEDFMANMQDPKNPEGIEASKDGETPKIVVYADPACPHCSEFDSQYGKFLEEKAQSGDADVEYRTVSFLDRNSPTNFSARAGNMLACVADTAPEKFMAVNSALYAGISQGERSDDELIELAKASEVDVESCVKDNKFRPFVAFTTAKAREDMVPGTPTVWVNGTMWDQQQDADFEAFVDAQISVDAKK